MKRIIEFVEFQLEKNYNWNELHLSIRRRIEGGGRIQSMHRFADVANQFQGPESRGLLVKHFEG